MSADAVHWAQRVVDRIGAPLDAWAVLATLEAEGLRDEDARARFRSADLRAFAEEVYRASRACAPSSAPPPPRARPAAPSALRSVARSLARGAPLAAQLAASLLWGRSLLSSSTMSARDSLLLNAAAVTSALAAGAAASVMGARAAAPLELGSVGGVRDALRGGVALAASLTLASLAAGVALGGLAAVGGLADLARYACLHLSLSAVWTALSALLVLRAVAEATAASVVACGLVLLAERAGASPWAAVVAGQAAFTLAATWRVAAHLRALAARLGEGPAAPPAADALAVGGSLPDLAYGGAYLALVLCDRILAWSADVPRAVIARYERGVNLALLAVIVPLALAEHLAEEFARESTDDAARCPADALAAYRARGVERLRSKLARLLRACLVSAAAVTALALALSPPPTATFGLALVGDQLLALGAFGALVHQQYGRRWAPARALATSAGIAVTVGYAASRVAGTAWAALGFTFGAAYFAAHTLAGARALAAKLDHAQHAAF